MAGGVSPSIRRFPVFVRPAVCEFGLDVRSCMVQFLLFRFYTVPFRVAYLANLQFFDPSPVQLDASKVWPCVGTICVKLRQSLELDFPLLFARYHFSRLNLQS